MVNVQGLVERERGLVSPEVYSDEEIYQQELEKVFGRCWLFVGHESSIPRPGDYLTNYMGADAVIVLRDGQGRVRVFLNKCLHRGNKVCLFDRGNAKTFTCSFHGWQYDTSGKIVGVPFYEEAYLGELDRQAWGLVQAPRVERYGGLIFACWDPNVIGLDTYLGDIRWYLDRLLVQPELGGLEVVGGRQRYTMPTNWKLLSDNFAGDDYHVAITHASYFKILAEDNKDYRGRISLDDALQVAFGYGSGVPHGLGALRVGGISNLYAIDLAVAERLGAEVVDWVKERYHRKEESLKNDPIKVHIFSNANIFPNFSMISSGGAFQGRGLIQWHPQGPLLTVGWQWCAVEKDAPKIVKEIAVRNLLSGQAAGGLIAPDDSENFERMTDNLLSHMTRKQPFNYAMASGHDADHPMNTALHERGLDQLPGMVGPYNWEVNQRQFYRYWAELMS